MADMNNVAVTGRIGTDLELKEVGDGVVCNLRLAIGGPREGQTDWIGVAVWDAQAENLCKYMQKGSRIGVTGRLQVDEWEQDGNKRERVGVRAVFVHYLDSKSEDGGAKPAAPAAAAMPEPEDDDEDPFQ